MYNQNKAWANAKPLLWRHMSRPMSQITANWTVCLTVIAVINQYHVQERGLRIILNDYQSDYKALLESSGRELMYISRLKKLACFVYKSCNNTGPGFTNDIFNKKYIHYNLRHNSRVEQPLCWNGPVCRCGFCILCKFSHVVTILSRVYAYVLIHGCQCLTHLCITNLSSLPSSSSSLSPSPSSYHNLHSHPISSVYISYSISVILSVNSSVS